MPMIRKRSRRKRRRRLRGLRTLLLVLGITGALLGGLLIVWFTARGQWQPVKLGILYLAVAIGLLGVCGLLEERGRGDG